MREGYVVLLLIGYQGAGRKSPGQLINATVVFSDGGGEEKVDFNTEGQYLTDRADIKKRRCWRMVKRTLSPGDSVRFEVFTAVRGAGEDSQLTGSWIYTLDPSEPIQAIVLPGIGPKGFPLAKGRLVELASTTKRDQLNDEVQQFIDDDTGM